MYGGAGVRIGGGPVVAGGGCPPTFAQVRGDRFAAGFLDFHGSHLEFSD